MRKLMLSIPAAVLLIANTVPPQELSRSQVPSVIVNEFQKEFPNARDIEWEMDSDSYNVEFEVGLTTDHEIMISRAIV